MTFNSTSIVVDEIGYIWVIFEALQKDYQSSSVAHLPGYRDLRKQSHVGQACDFLQISRFQALQNKGNLTDSLAGQSGQPENILCSNLAVTTFPSGVRYFYLTGLINSNYLSGDRRLSLILQGKMLCPQRSSYAKDYKELLSLDCDAILFDILLFIDLLTRIMPLSLFHLNSPRVRQHQLAVRKFPPTPMAATQLWLGGGTIELSILEVAGHFGLFDIARTSQDHVKRGFGILTVLQGIPI
ncbi:hypothetical protein PHYBLDRAFT_161681 [Phycomyces blakesleeanus NRRL 1555(-)]|uniref:Uncharacterized protein n=1 Tax=Phycomyces blakesleeanus (strain ATCC 8743b / DSM 1359 / FGSC 10004 / NBRC 33097 / NRRL 1555) TaxID=763407 RepID=A0A162YJ35_PHYB8|nr:hypothetical protein PHYBLDRAFT_161681 [Phycomyces blakesleeanus NRRL 1555(-)]OAD81045.1 hypothetical protein PHYBLDRAFT_161681 [Phycomyces blakesleeanus NRRL 1555(-)]|eukprot:XP_018299085.1 hypothetical protein PHYBLDRAFT_161681 [Phycomyces blakesleeanus NRRL 1555(-)]